MKEHYIPVAINIRQSCSELGRGGFAKVVKCKRVSDGKILALKCIKSAQYKRDEILQECALNKVLHCQYIVCLEELIEWKDHLFLAFELMDRDMSNLNGVTSEAFCQFTIYQVAKGL